MGASKQLLYCCGFRFRFGLQPRLPNRDHARHAFPARGLTGPTCHRDTAAHTVPSNAIGAHMAQASTEATREDVWGRLGETEGDELQGQCLEVHRAHGAQTTLILDVVEILLARTRPMIGIGPIKAQDLGRQVPILEQTETLLKSHRKVSKRRASRLHLMPAQHEGNRNQFLVPKPRQMRR